MNEPAEDRVVACSQQWYERLLALYPQAHRWDYGPAMAQLFRDQCRDAWRAGRGWGLAALWLRVLPDLLKTSVVEHLAKLKGRKSMIERIALLLRPRSAPVMVFLAVFAAVFLLVFGAAALITFLLPESYASTARIRVERDASDITPMDYNSRPAGSSYDPYFIQTEFEVIGSELILDRVIASLRLDETWAKKYGVAGTLPASEVRTLLRRQMDLRPVRNTSLIEIRVFSDKPQEAADIANKVAEVYRDYRVEQRVNLSLNAVKTLKAQYTEQERKLEQKQAEVDRLRRDLNLADADSSGTGSGPSDPTEIYRRLSSMRAEYTMLLSREEAQLDRLKSLDRLAQVQALPTALPVPDVRLNELLQERNLAERKLNTYEQGDYGPLNPAVVKVKAELATMEKQLDVTAEGILAGLASRVEQDRAGLSNIARQVEAAQKADLEESEQSRSYFAAKRELDEMLGWRRILRQKLESEKTEVDLRRVPIEIVDRAVPGLRPVRPNKPLNLFLGALAGMLLGGAGGAGTAWTAARIGRSSRGNAVAP